MDTHSRRCCCRFAWIAAAAGLCLSVAVLTLSLSAAVLQAQTREKSAMTSSAAKRLALPEPRKSGEVSVEQAIEKRRSVRNFRDRGLTLEQIAQLLWSAQGITGPGGLRASPSAGATYPLEVYLVNGRENGLAAGLYRYLPATHELERIVAGDLREPLTRAALNQRAVDRAPATVVIAAVYERTTARYGERGIRYVHMEAGHAAQNLYLQSEALELGGVVIGAFRDREVSRVLRLPENEAALYLMPIGHPQ